MRSSKAAEIKTGARIKINIPGLEATVTVIGRCGCLIIASVPKQTEYDSGEKFVYPDQIVEVVG